MRKGDMVVGESAVGVLLGLGLPWYSVSIESPYSGARPLAVAWLSGCGAGGYRYHLVVLALGLVALVAL